MALYPLRLADRMTVIVIVRADLRGVVRRGTYFARAPVVGVDNTVARLIRFRGDQLVQIQSGSLLFGDMWRVLLSWRVATLGPR